MKSCIITFPGSNCDKDIGFVLKKFYFSEVHYLWHKDNTNEKYDLVILPGGFSYGDYLRTGAMARFAKAMETTVAEHINRGGMLLGICNGFQILTEAGLLPGALTRNKGLKFICRDVKLKKGSTNVFTKIDEIILPIAHADGAYYVDAETLKKLNDNNRILLRYNEENPNGSLDSIAGIVSIDGRIIGLMPHPERAMNDATGRMDGKIFFDNLFLNL